MESKQNLASLYKYRQAIPYGRSAQSVRLPLASEFRTKLEILNLFYQLSST